jgi:hypothetical protein
MRVSAAPSGIFKFKQIRSLPGPSQIQGAVEQIYEERPRSRLVPLPRLMARRIALIKHRK